MWYTCFIVGKELFLSTKGRLVIPASIRHELHLKPGDALVVHTECDKLVLEKKAALAKRLKGSLKGTGKGSAVEQLISERREQAWQIK